MSFYLLPQKQFFKQLQRDQKSPIQSIQSEEQTLEVLLLGDTLKNQLKFIKQSIMAQTIHIKGNQRFILMKIDLGFKLKGLISIKFNNKNQQFNFSVDILGPAQNYYKAENLFQAIQICRNFNAKHSCFNQSLICLRIDPCKRQIKVELPSFLNYNWPTLKKSNKTNKIISLIVHTLIKPHLDSIEECLRNTLIQNGWASAKDLMLLKPNKNIEAINQYNSLSNIATHIPCHAQRQHLFASRNIQNKIQSIKNLIKNQLPLQSFLIKNDSLFSHRMDDNYQCKNLIDQACTNKMQKTMKSKIFIPSPPYSQQPEENFMIQNKIQIQNIRNLKFQKIKAGGFANIYQTRVNFWYPYLSDGKTPNPNEFTNRFSQIMAMKLDVPTVNMFQDDNEFYQKSRRQHQMSIISRLKTGKSIYIPKYYFATNLQKHKNSILNQALLIQHIPFRTLQQILQQNSFCLSLYSKVVLMFSICQGLRYLRDFDIVHLDLKPNNIMTYKNSYIKLIDFGQSYHHQICGDIYEPGFTVPYSAPQIFNDKIKYFTSKTDVFSFGIIFYQMLFNKFPYEIYDTSKNIEQQMQQYLQYWYYSSQEGESYGEGKIIRMLVLLISKCLSLNKVNRPELDSIGFILKLILEVIN